MRMRPHIMVRTRRNFNRPKVIEKQERPDALRLRRRQQTANVKAGGEFFGVGAMVWVMGIVFLSPRF